MDYTSINSLLEFSFIAGTTYTLEFTVIDDGSMPVDLGAATCTWKMSYFSNPTETVLTKTGTVFGAGNDSFRIELTTADTEDLYGKFIHQPIVVDFVGNEYRQSQGLLHIIPRA